MVTVEYPPALYPGQPITVTVAYNFPIATPFIHGMIHNGTLTLRQQASEPIISQR